MAKLEFDNSVQRQPDETDQKNRELLPRALAEPPKFGKVDTLYICACGEQRSPFFASERPLVDAYFKGGFGKLNQLIPEWNSRPSVLSPYEDPLKDKKQRPKLDKAREKALALFESASKIVVLVPSADQNPLEIKFLKEKYPDKVEVVVSQDRYNRNLSEQNYVPGGISHLRQSLSREGD